MKVNIRDVAQHAGVSIATVSHVLNNTRRVSDATAQQVMNSVRELGYVPNSLARSFKLGRRNLIGCIIPDISNYFWSLVIEEIETFLSMHNYLLIIANTKETEQRELDNIALLSSGIVDGLIIASTLNDGAQISGLLPDSFPAVLIDRTLSHAAYDCITISNYASIYQGVSHLIQRGHRKIGYISGLPHLSTTRERLQAYHDAMSHYGLDVPDSLIRSGMSMSPNALKPAAELLDQGCTALVISNNVMAVDVMSYLYRENPPLSRRVDILGYQEGNRDVCMIQPAGLISQPAQQMGQLAAQQILNRINTPDAGVQQFMLSSSLTLFESNGEPPYMG